jgi:hypothetical protein
MIGAIFADEDQGGVYPGFAQKLVELLSRVAINDGEIDRVNNALPRGYDEEAAVCAATTTVTTPRAPQKKLNIY